MKKIAVLTATRAEYGLLSPIIKGLQGGDIFDVRIIVTGAHLSPEFGLTFREIEKDEVKIDKKIETLLSGDTSAAISKSMGLAMIGFADYFSENRPDALMVLGDRYETLAVCCAAMNECIPIIHLHGGETTEGAVDEAIRHAITKMSYLHFTSTEEYRRRVIQLGESPDRVFNVGAIGVENALKTRLLGREDLEKSLNFPLDKPYAVVTFHPVTLEQETAGDQYAEVLKAFAANPELKYIITKANADRDGRVINQMTDEFTAKHKNAVSFDSLGKVRYLSALKYAALVIGNSSSGIIEAPSFNIPTINIGDRQKGRLQAESVLNCVPETAAVSEAIKKAMSEGFRNAGTPVVNPYGDGNTTEKIIDVIKKTFVENRVDLKKIFYDIR